jgi:GntR family transcriptional regulator, transcriptional repressor for pyruvate dehydrogenase complex
MPGNTGWPNRNSYLTVASKIVQNAQYPAKKREKLADVLYNAILKSILDGELKEGDRLPGEEALSEQYRVSRPTIREALARLRAGGLIISRQGSGSYVGRAQQQHALKFSEIASVADFQRCYEFRRGIEAGAARHAALMRNADDMERIQAAYERLQTAIRRGEPAVEEDFALHMAIAVAAKNPFFSAVLDSIHSQTVFSMSLSRNLSREQGLQRMASADKEHRAVIDAILKQDADGAAAAMRAHISNSIVRILGSEMDQ